MADRPMLPTNMLNVATGAMRSLHDSVLSLKKWRLRENDVAYPVLEILLLGVNRPGEAGLTP